MPRMNRREFIPLLGGGVAACGAGAGAEGAGGRLPPQPIA
jgi:hypothetical protein